VTEKLANTGCQGAPASIILLQSSFVLDLAASAVVDWPPCRVPVNFISSLDEIETSQESVETCDYKPFPFDTRHRRNR